MSRRRRYGAQYLWVEEGGAAPSSRDAFSQAILGAQGGSQQAGALYGMAGLPQVPTTLYTAPVAQQSPGLSSTSHPVLLETAALSPTAQGMHEHSFLDDFEEARAQSQRLMAEINAIADSLRAEPDPSHRERQGHPERTLEALAAIRDHAAFKLRVTVQTGAFSRKKRSAYPPPPLNPAISPKSTDRFTLSWNEPVRCWYNKRIALDIFAPSLLSHPIHSVPFRPFTEADLPELLRKIATQFLRHCEHLYKIRSEQIDELTDVEQLCKAKGESRDHRRDTLYEKRLRLCHYYNKPVWAAALQILGGDGMSSDEGENPVSTGRQKTYIIIDKDYRNGEMIQWLHVLCDLYPIYELENKTVGARARRRIHSGVKKLSARPTPGKWPQNFYTEAQQTRFGKYHRYSPTIVPIDFSLLLHEAKELLAAERGRLAGVLHSS